MIQSIKHLIQHLNVKDVEKKREYDAFSITDNNVLALQNRILALEKKNMRYFCRAYRSTDQSIPINTPTNISFDKTEYPQWGSMHDNTILPSRIYIRRSGLYQIHAGVQFGPSSGGTTREVYIALNRGGVISILAEHTNGPAPGANSIHLPVSTVYYLYEDDFILLTVLHDVNPSLNIEGDYPHSPYLAVIERPEDLDPSQFGSLDPNANMR